MAEKKNNSVCDICGKSYYACLSCSETTKLHPYKMYCCSPHHFQVFQVVRGFSTGVYTKDEFKSKLKNIDLSDLENYREHIKVLIKDALKEDEPVVETITEHTYDDIVFENVEAKNIDGVEKASISRKRYYKTNNEAIEAE